MVVLGPGMVEFDELAWRLKENDTTYFYVNYCNNLLYYEVGTTDLMCNIRTH